MSGRICVGLFGTCGGSKWREAFETRYRASDIISFNPQKSDWKPEDAVEEAEHLANDEIILFPVTGETYGTGSLAETGFSILSTVRMDTNRFVVVMIDKDINPVLKEENPVAAKESIRARALVRAHLRKVKYKNVYVVETFDEMMEVSLQIHHALNLLKAADAILDGIKGYRPEGR